MEKLSLKLAKTFFEEILGEPLENFKPVAITGADAINILWPLNDIFRPHLDTD